MYRGRIRQIHMVGIGGAGMSGIAEVLLNMGYRVTGSDIRETKVTKRLASLGCRIHYGHSPENVEGADVVVVSSAIREDNPEVRAAREQAIPVIPRAEMLAELMRVKYGVAVAGAHGKTTTTSMIAAVLAQGGLDPTVVIGGRLKGLGGGARLGEGDFMVAEADESDGSFLRLSPTVAVVTNIDREHIDFYGDMDHLKEAFLEFMNKVPFYGSAILSMDDEHLQELIPHLRKRYITYGLSSQADVRAEEVERGRWEVSFSVTFREEGLGRIRLPLPGLHNVYNALAAVACGLELEIPFPLIEEALSSFSGVERRFQRKGEVDGVLVIDDYAHHPTEIKATLATARNLGRRVIALFQPHRYSRVKDLFEEFLTAFYDADLLFVTEIYPAGEEPVEGVNAEGLYRGIREHGHRKVQFVPEKERLVPTLLPILSPGDVVITLGAGNIYEVAEELLEELRR